MSDTKVEGFLEHYGVKGQKWGVRKSRNESARKSQFGPSKDSKKASNALKKAKKSGVKSLTNDELKSLNQRLQLEKSFSEVTAQSGKRKKGMTFAKEVLTIGNTANQAYTLINSPAAKAVQASIKKK